MRMLLLGAALAAAMAVARWGVSAVVLLLLTLPVAAETMREAGQRLALTIYALALAAVCWWKLPAEALMLALGWCAVAVGLLWIPVPHLPAKRGVLWGGLTAAAACAGLAILGRHYPGLISEGLAEDAVGWIDRREDAVSILLQAYQSGLAGLEEELAVMPAVRLFGVVIMPENVRVELLRGLRTSIALLLEAWMPRLIVGWTGLTGLLCAVTPDAYRRRQGLKAGLPAFGTWRLSKDMNLTMILLMLGGVMSCMATSRVTAQAFGMCGTAFRDIYLVLGMCTMSWMMKARGCQRLTRRLVLAGGAVLAPTAMVIIGLADQVLNLRKPRCSTDE